VHVCQHLPSSDFGVLIFPVCPIFMQQYGALMNILQRSLLLPTENLRVSEEVLMYSTGLCVT